MFNRLTSRLWVRKISIVAICLGVLSCSVNTSNSNNLSSSGQAAVAMPDSYSADAARYVLERGGNAIDAAIAAQFVMAVTLREARNIGGGGFMLVHNQGFNDFIDYIY